MLVLDDRVARRRAIHRFYSERLKEAPGITVMQSPNPDYNSNFWLTCILVHPGLAGKTGEDIRLKMEDNNIETRPLWKPLHLQPVFSACPYYGEKVCESLFENGLCLPSGSALKEHELNRIVEIIDNTHP
jgi:dTDP-4-amino-4,6-dideoxygalactose transaminase